MEFTTTQLHTPHHAIRRQLVDYGLWNYGLPGDKKSWPLAYKAVKDSEIELAADIGAGNSYREDVLFHWHTFKNGMNNLTDAILNCYEHMANPGLAAYYEQQMSLAWETIRWEMEYFQELAGANSGLPGAARVEQEWKPMLSNIYEMLDRTTDTVIAEAGEDFRRQEITASYQRRGVPLPPDAFDRPEPTESVAAIESAADSAPARVSHADPHQEALGMLLRQRALLPDHQMLRLQHRIRDALCELKLPGAAMSWYEQLLNAARYRQSFLRSEPDSVPKPSRPSVLILKRECEKALDHLAMQAATHYEPGNRNAIIEQSLSHLTDTVKALVDSVPNAKASLGRIELKEAMQPALYERIHAGFDQAASDMVATHAEQIVDARRSSSKDGPGPGYPLGGCS